MLASFAAIVLLSIAGCKDPAGNDPNVPDDEPRPPMSASDDGGTDGADNDGGSPMDAAPVCTKKIPGCTSVPSYTADVAPLVHNTCLPCHAKGGTASDRDLTTYRGIVRIESTVLSQIYSCDMPPADAGPDAALTAPERTLLLQWLVCGAPNN